MKITWNTVFPTERSKLTAAYVLLCGLLVAVIASGMWLVSTVNSRLRQRDDRIAVQSAEMQMLVGKTIRSVSGAGKPIIITTEDGTTVSIDAYKYPLQVELH